MRIRNVDGAHLSTSIDSVHSVYEMIQVSYHGSIVPYTATSLHWSTTEAAFPSERDTGADFVSSNFLSAVVVIVVAAAIALLDMDSRHHELAIHRLSSFDWQTKSSSMDSKKFAAWERSEIRSASLNGGVGSGSNAKQPSSTHRSIASISMIDVVCREWEVGQYL